MNIFIVFLALALFVISIALLTSTKKTEVGKPSEEVVKNDHKKPRKKIIILVVIVLFGACFSSCDLIFNLDKYMKPKIVVLNEEGYSVTRVKELPNLEAMIDRGSRTPSQINIHQTKVLERVGLGGEFLEKIQKDLDFDKYDFYHVIIPINSQNIINLQSASEKYIKNPIISSLFETYDYLTHRMSSDLSMNLGEKRKNEVLYRLWGKAVNSIPKEKMIDGVSVKMWKSFKYKNERYNSGLGYLLRKKGDPKMKDGFSSTIYKVQFDSLYDLINNKLVRNDQIDTQLDFFIEKEKKRMRAIDAMGDEFFEKIKDHIKSDMNNIDVMMRSIFDQFIEQFGTEASFRFIPERIVYRFYKNGKIDCAFHHQNAFEGGRKRFYQVKWEIRNPFKMRGIIHRVADESTGEMSIVEIDKPLMNLSGIVKGRKSEFDDLIFGKFKVDLRGVLNVKTGKTIEFPFYAHFRRFNVFPDRSNKKAVISFGSDIYDLPGWVQGRTNLYHTFAWINSDGTVEQIVKFKRPGRITKKNHQPFVKNMGWGKDGRFHVEYMDEIWSIEKK